MSSDSGMQRKQWKTVFFLKILSVSTINCLERLKNSGIALLCLCVDTCLTCSYGGRCRKL